MCDKKTIVLFIDIRCFVLSPDFKLADESQVLLKVPRKNNMYSVDMENIVPKESLTCLVAKATLDESMLWHRRLGHWNGYLRKGRKTKPKRTKPDSKWKSKEKIKSKSKPKPEKSTQVNPTNPKVKHVKKNKFKGLKLPKS
ncbi:ribonuclease H-like domain-containing protein [Tanacetum coccineum]